MTKSLGEYSREELIDEIKRLKKQKRFGLVWEDKPEKVVKECETKLPVVKEMVVSRILCKLSVRSFPHGLLSLA